MTGIIAAAHGLITAMVNAREEQALLFFVLLSWQNPSILVPLQKILGVYTPRDYRYWSNYCNGLPYANRNFVGSLSGLP
jgi:hypothetical protein